ncbi:MAG: hypothetical protein P8I91_06030 [Phycisphaerales bacterium]|nr:hypothetical protein [Phycisphaerales bacterium]
MQLIATMLAIATTGASAATFHLSNNGELTLSGTLSTYINGTLIGDWDAESNPEGTQTREGVWGGSGNNPIPLSLTAAIELGGNTIPTGPLDLEIDDILGVASITNLSWDVLPESVLSAAANGTILIETFRSINPDSLFIGGVPISFPLGEGSVTSCTITQTVIPGVGPATARPDEPGVTDILVAVPMTLDMMVMTELLGEFPLQFALILNIEGVYTQGDGKNTLSLTATSTVDESADLPDQPLPTIPVELPTVLPPGSEAGVLLDLTPTTIDILINITSNLIATDDGDQPSVPGDVNGDNLVSTDDLLAVLAAFGPCEDCPEDFNSDDVVDVNDILTVVGNWST